MRNWALAIVMSLGISAAIGVAPSAAAISTDTIPGIQPVELLPQDEFIAQTQVFSQTPLDDESLAYKLYLPKDWTKVESDMIGDVAAPKVSLDILGIMARFYGPPQLDERSFFTIQALDLDYDITMEGWFLTFARNNGYSVEEMDIVSEEKVHARYVDMKDSTPFQVRLVAIMNGERIVVARYYVPQRRYSDEKVMQEQIIQNFSLLSKKSRPQNRETYAFLDQSYFDYPKTWQLNSGRILSIERMQSEIRDISPSGDMNARIRVFTISRLLGTSLGDEVKRFMENFEIKGYRLGGVIEQHNFKHHREMDFAKTEVYKLVPDTPLMLKYEIWVSVLRNDDYYYIVTLLVPTRDQEYFTWSRATEVYKIVLSTLRRYK